MSASRAFLLMVCFFLDVHVKAETPAAEDCWGKNVPCAVEAVDKVVHLGGGALAISLGRDAVIEQRTEKRIQIVTGSVYADVDSAVEFAAPFARFTCASECQGLFTRQAEAITLQVLQGVWVVQRLGDRQKYSVRSGQQLRVAEVTLGGAAEMEFPQSVPWMPTVKAWARLFPGKADAFKMEVKRFRAEWNSAVNQVSALHRDYAGRTIASYQKELDEQRARQKAQEKEDQSLRELFREKNNIHP